MVHAAAVQDSSEWIKRIKLTSQSDRNTQAVTTSLTCLASAAHLRLMHRGGQPMSP
jgi:hypothetical protein